MKKEKKKSNLGQVIMFILFFVLCGGCGFFGARYVDVSLGNESPQKKIMFLILVLVFLYLSIFLHIIIHEGGHLIFGLLSGYEFASFRVANIMFVKKKDGIKVKKYSLAGTGGQCLMYMKDYNDGNYPYKLYNLGGVLNNIIFSALAYIIYLFTRENKYLAAFLIMFAIIGILLAITNAVPIAGIVNNDGRNALDLAKSKEARRGLYQMLKINALVTDEVRLKDMDDDLFTIPDKEYLANPLSASIGAFAVSREMDKMNFADVMDKGNYMLENAEGLVPIYQYSMKLDMMYCKLVTENNKEEIDELFDKAVQKFVKASKKNISVLRTQYAYSLFYNKDEAKAEKYLADFNKYAESYPHQCEIESERALVNYAKSRYYSHNN